MRLYDVFGMSISPVKSKVFHTIPVNNEFSDSSHLALSSNHTFRMNEIYHIKKEVNRNPSGECITAVLKCFHEIIGVLTISYRIT